MSMSATWRSATECASARSPVSDPDTLLVHVIAPKVEEEEEAEEAAEGAEAAPAEGDASEAAAKGKDEEGGSSSGS